MSDIFIAGVSMTSFGPQTKETVKSLSTRSIRDCLLNAGASLGQVEAVYFSNANASAVTTQGDISKEVTADYVGLDTLIAARFMNGSTCGSTAFWRARNHLISGQSDIALVLGTEKMSPPKMKNNSYAWFTDNYTMGYRAHMMQFGTTQRQLALISSKNHANSTLNPKCHYSQPISVEEVLNSRCLTYPFTVPMCAPASDGSSATLLCTSKGLKKINSDKKAVRIDSCVRETEEPKDGSDFENHLVRRTASKAYAQAGIGPEDIDLAELYDAASFGELLMTELLGFCETGAGGQFASSGASMLNGRIPVNPSGGLESKGHPFGATGLAQIYELVTQIRGEAGSRQVVHNLVAVQQSGDGMYQGSDGAAVVTVLSR
jgi:acetyl-CoA acyltransferase